MPEMPLSTLLIPLDCSTQESGARARILVRARISVDPEADFASTGSPAAFSGKIARRATRRSLLGQSTRLLSRNREILFCLFARSSLF